MPRAFVVGNAAWDETLHLAALPVPGASVHVRRGAAGPGGKGLNQAVALARAGVVVTLVAAVGEDAAGERVAVALEAEGLGAGVVRRLGVATDWSGVLVSDTGENAILSTRHAADSLDAKTAIAGLASAAPGDLCLLQGNLTSGTTAAVIAEARRRGMRIALNPSPVVAGFAPLLAQVDALFLNREEALAFARATTPEAVRALGAGQAVITLGAEGALLVRADGAVLLVEAVRVAAVDPTGAGDAFLGTALAQAARRSWRLDGAALRAGAAAAALAASRPGAFAALPSREELAAIIAAR